MYDVLNVWNRVRNYVTISLGVVTLVAGAGWYVTNLRLETATEKVKTCEEGRALDRKTYEAAQNEYKARALEEKLAIEERNRHRAEEADLDYRSLLAKYNAALVRRYASVGGTNGTTDLPRASSSPSGSDGPSPNPVVPEVTITYEDAEICAENTARLQVAQEWAKGRE